MSSTQAIEPGNMTRAEWLASLPPCTYCVALQPHPRAVHEDLGVLLLLVDDALAGHDLERANAWLMCVQTASVNVAELPSCRYCRSTEPPHPEAAHFRATVVLRLLKLNAKAGKVITARHWCAEARRLVPGMPPPFSVRVIRRPGRPWLFLINGGRGLDAAQ